MPALRRYFCGAHSSAGPRLITSNGLRWLRVKHFVAVSVNYSREHRGDQIILPPSRTLRMRFSPFPELRLQT